MMTNYSYYETEAGYKIDGKTNEDIVMAGGGTRNHLTKEDASFHSSRNFPSGTLIQTDVDYSQDNGDQFLLEIKGNMYDNNMPLDAKIQGYIYYGSLINVAAYTTCYYWKIITALNYNGKLCFWFPQLSYWQGFDVKLTVGYGGIGQGQNRVTNVSDHADPGGTKRVSIYLKTLATQEYVNENFATIQNLNNYQPLGQYVRIGGDNTTGNNVLIGWTGDQAQLTVDATTIGNLWHSENFNPNTKANGHENAKAIGFSSGSYPTDIGNEYPYFYFDNGTITGYIPIATQGYVNNRIAANLANYVTTGTPQDINARKSIGGGTGNNFSGAALEIRGNGNGSAIYPSLSFHQPGQYAGIISLRNDYEFSFMNISGNGYNYLRSAGYIKEGSNDGYVLTGAGGHKPISDFAIIPVGVTNWTSNNFNPAQYVKQTDLNTQLGNYATLNGTQTFNGTNSFSQNIIIPFYPTLLNHATSYGFVADYVDQREGIILNYVAATYMKNQVATSNVLGGIKLITDTVNNIAPNAVTTVLERSYAVQLNNLNQAVVNVPWIDYGNHATAGYAKLTGTAQTFTNTNTFTSPPKVPSANNPDEAIPFGQATEISISTVRDNFLTRTTTLPSNVTYHLSNYGSPMVTNIVIKGNPNGELYIDGLDQGMTIKIMNTSALNLIVRFDGGSLATGIGQKTWIEVHRDSDGDLIKNDTQNTIVIT